MESMLVNSKQYNMLINDWDTSLELCRLADSRGALPAEQKCSWTYGYEVDLGEPGVLYIATDIVFMYHSGTQARLDLKFYHNQDTIDINSAIAMLARPVKSSRNV